MDSHIEGTQTIPAKRNAQVEIAGLDALLCADASLLLPAERGRVIGRWAEQQTDAKRVTRILRNVPREDGERILLHLPAETIDRDLLEYVGQADRWTILAERELLPADYLALVALVKEDFIARSLDGGSWYEAERHFQTLTRLAEGGAELRHGPKDALLQLATREVGHREDGAISGRVVCQIGLIRALAHFRDLTREELDRLLERLSHLPPVAYNTANLIVDPRETMRFVLGHRAWEPGERLALARKADASTELLRALSAIEEVRTAPDLRPILLERSDEESLVWLGLDAGGDELDRIAGTLVHLAPDRMLELIERRQRRGDGTPIDRSTGAELLSRLGDAERLRAVSLLGWFNANA